MTMPAARKPSGSSVSITSAMAMPKSTYRRLSRPLTFSDWSKPTSSLMRFGSSLANPFVAAITRSRTSRMLYPSFWLAVTNTARLPLKRPV